MMLALQVGRMAYEKVGIALGAAGIAVGIAAFTYDVYSSTPKTIVAETSSFHCELQPEPNAGGQVWTVVYRYGRNGTEFKPWLRMVRSMGGDWDTLARCEEIATRLDIFRKDGLLAFNYRTDPDTPGQYVLCAKTKVSGDNCPLVLTLMPDDAPYVALREVAAALVPGNLPSYQCSNPGACPPAKPVFISLEGQL